MQDFEGNIALRQSVNVLKDNFEFNTRQFPSFSFGNAGLCKRILENAILSVDQTIEEFIWIPEYEQVVEWMINTKGKGLFLTGDVGRGKTDIIFHVIPLIFYHFKKKVVKTVLAEELGAKLPHLKTKKFIAVDEMGCEPVHNDYGSKFEPINRLFNLAETQSKILFVSTNLDSSQVLERYGVRTLDRIRRLCKVIKFSGESMRK